MSIPDPSPRSTTEAGLADLELGLTSANAMAIADFGDRWALLAVGGEDEGMVVECAQPFVPMPAWRAAVDAHGGQALVVTLVGDGSTVEAQWEPERERGRYVKRVAWLNEG